MLSGDRKKERKSYLARQCLRALVNSWTERTGKGAWSTRYRGHYIEVEIGDGNKRLSVYPPVWETLKKTEEVKLCIGRGILGYDYVKIEE